MLRDAYVLQGGLDQRMPPPSDGDPLKGLGTAFEFAKFIDRSLPPRLRMGDFRMFRQIDLYSRHPLRWLLKTVSETWRKVGVPRKRGELSPALVAGLTSVNLARNLCEGMLDGTADENFGLQPVAEMIRENGKFAQQQGWL